MNNTPFKKVFTLSVNFFSYKSGFSLIELMVVIIIVGILAKLAFPNYLRMREKAYDKEPQANLPLIAASERNYRLADTSNLEYIACADTAAINQNLSLVLPVGQQWNYTAIAGTNFCIQAQRITDGRCWHMHINGSSVDALPQPSACS